ncbi:4,5-DOPA dioxygenase extradiol 1-like isoform X2 [Chrysoperla carnea]|nr:4,5-DOPA dioxygenase extradiol 1-like isoform X2 [Chrysoperla carnea]
MEESSKSPVYFISHGGPDFMYMKEFGGYEAVQKIGKEIKNLPYLKGIIIVSAHWESTPDEIYVNTAEHTELIHDFDRDRWPSYMFEEQYANVGSKEISSKILQLLKDANIKAVSKSRGLDHGAWVPFKIAFPSDKIPLSVPIVQISLYTNEDPNLHFNVGRALSPLRNEGIVIIGSGMSVHNLNERDLYADNEVAKYVVPFDNAVVDAMTKNKGEARRIALNELLKRSDIRNAHPTFEHFFPLFVVSGAAYEDTGDLLFTSYEGSFAWGQYRLGSIG